MRRRHLQFRILLAAAALTSLAGCCAKPLVMADADYRADIVALDRPSVMAVGEKRKLLVRLTNASEGEWQTRGVDERNPWRGNDTGQYAMFLADRWLDTSGKAVVNDDGRSQPPDVMAPGEQATMKLGIRAPSVPGEYILELDVVRENVAWFAQKGSSPTRYHVKVE